MAEATGDTGGWKTQAPRHPAARNWRRGWGAGSVRGERRKRRLQIVSAGVLLAVLLGVIVYLLLRPDRFQDAHLIAVGLSSYPDRRIPPNPYGREDVALLKSRFPQVRIWDDKLTADVLLQGGESYAGGTVVVFASMHGKVEAGSGGAGSGQARLLISGGEVAVPQLLAKLAQLRARQVLLLLDAGRLPTNWRLGVLRNDFATQLAEDVGTAEMPGLCVICSCSAGERSWEGRGRDEHSSIFGRYVVEALAGAADGWGDRGAGQTALDRRIDSDELFWYVKHHVAERAERDRGSRQTVCRFPEQPPRIDLVQVRAPDLTASGVDAPGVGTFGGGEPAAPTGAGAAAAGTEAAPAAAAESTSAGRTESKATKAAAPKPTADSADGRKTAPAGAPQGSNVAADPVLPEALHKQLIDCWRRRDQQRLDGRAAARTPYSWRKLQSHLLLAEQQLRAELWPEAAETLRRAETLLSEIDRRVSAARWHGPGRQLPSGSLALSGGAASAELKPEDRQKLQQLLETLAGPAAPADAPAEQLAELERTLQSTADAGRAWVFDWLLQRGVTATDRGTLRKLGAVLGTLVDRGDLPVELLCLQVYCRRAAEWPDSREWPAASVTAALRLRMQAERLAVDSPDATVYLRSRLTDALNALVAAERWLFDGGSSAGREAAPWLAVAERSLSAAAGNPPELQAVRLRDQWLAELPDFARWVAARAEADPSASREFSRLERLAGLLRESPAADAAVTGTEFESSFTANEQLLLQLMHHAEQIDAVVRRAGGDVPLAPADLERLRALAQSGEVLWTSFSSRFDAEVKTQLDAESADAQAILDILQVPWIAAEDRRRLNQKLDLPPKTVLVAERVAAANAGGPAGVKQAFWAVRTLALAGSEADRLGRVWRAWGEFVSDAAAGKSALRLAHGRAELGRLIEQAWSELSRDTDLPAVPPIGSEHFARLDRRARGIDGLDEPKIRSAGSVHDPDFVVLAGRQAQFEAWVREHVQRTWLAHSGRHGEFYRAVERLLAVWAETPHAGSLPPRLQLPGDVPLRSHEAAVLPLRLAADTSVAGARLRVAFHPDAALAALHEGRPVLQTLDWPETGDWGVQLQPRGQLRGPAELTVVLLDAGNHDVPLDVCTVTVYPPFDPTQWRVVFTAAVDGGADPEVRPRPQEQGGALLHLPAFSPEPPTALKAFLERPENDSSSKVTVTVLRNTRGEPQPLGSPREMVFPAGTRRVPVAAPSAKAADATSKPPAGSGAAADPPVPMGVDVAEGLIFRIETETGDRADFLVQPVFWPAEKYVETPAVRFDGKTLEVVIRRRSVQDGGSPLPKVPVSLQLPAEMLALKQELDLGSDEPVLGFDAELKLRAVLQASVDGPFEIALSAGGIPHAYRWDIQKGREPRPISETRIRVLVHEPAGARAVLRGRDQLQARFEIDTFDIDPVRDRLVYALAPVGTAAPVPLGEVPLSAALEKHVELQAGEEGTWQFRTAARDHVRDIRVPTALGRFQLSAALWRSGQQRARDVIELGIDSEDSPPVVSRAEFQVENPAAGTHPVGRPLRVVVQASDPQSGIRELALSEESQPEVKLAVRSDPGGEPVAFDLPAAALPAEAGTRNYVVTVTNGVGLVASRRQRVNFVPSSRPPPDRTGNLTVTVSFPRLAYKWVLTGPKNVTEQLPLGTSSFTFTNLPAGTYEVQVVGSRRSSEKVKVDVEAGKTSKVELEAKLN